MDRYKANCCIFNAPLSEESFDRILHYSTFWKTDEDLYYYDSFVGCLEGPFKISTDRRSAFQQPCPKNKHSLFFGKYAVNRSLSFFNIPMDPIRLEIDEDTKTRIQENLNDSTDKIFVQHLQLMDYGLYAPGRNFNLFSKKENVLNETIFKDNLISIKESTLRSALTGKTLMLLLEL